MNMPTGDDPAPARPTHLVTGFAGRDHRARPPAARIAALVGLAAALVAIGLGTAMLLGTPTPTPTAELTAQRITVSTAPPTVPLSAHQILGLLRQRPDYGPLDDLGRRASCLAGLGFPAISAVLGAEPLDVGGKPAVLLVLPGERPGELAAVVVPPSCSSTDTGMLADTRVNRP